MDCDEDYSKYEFEDDRYECVPSTSTHRQNNAEKMQCMGLFGDRRKKVEDKGRKDIIKCIGKVRSIRKWIDKNASRGEGDAGTATVFKYDCTSRYAYAITCAHNVMRNPDSDDSDHYLDIIFQRKMTTTEAVRKLRRNWRKKDTKYVEGMDKIVMVIAQLPYVSNKSSSNLCNFITCCCNTYIYHRENHRTHGLKQIDVKFNNIKQYHTIKIDMFLPVVNNKNIWIELLEHAGYIKVSYNTLKFDQSNGQSMIKLQNVKKILKESGNKGWDLIAKDPHYISPPKLKKFEEYQIINFYHLDYKHKDCVDNDLAILVFQDHDGYYKHLFGRNPNKIKLFPSDKIPKRQIIEYSCYGYPHNDTEKRTEDIWGMKAPSYKVVTYEDKDNDIKQEHEFYFRKHEKTDKSIFKYNAIDTEGGQSGSAIFTSFRDRTYGIVGIHTGGNGDGNWGVALDQKRIDWINKCMKLYHCTDHKCDAVLFEENENKTESAADTQFTGDEFRECGHIQAVKDDWSDFKVMFNSIGWSEIPDKLQDDDKEMYGIVLMIKKQGTTPSKIRKKQDFISIMKLDSEFYKKYEKYIDDHLN